jgi:hypothetical protein
VDEKQPHPNAFMNEELYRLRKGGCTVEEAMKALCYTDKSMEDPSIRRTVNCRFYDEEKKRNGGNKDVS